MRPKAKNLIGAEAGRARRQLNRVELRGLEPRTEPGEMALELRFLLFGVVMRVLGFLGICVGVLRDVTVVAQC